MSGLVKARHGLAVSPMPACLDNPKKLGVLSEKTTKKTILLMTHFKHKVFKQLPVFPFQHTELH
ncbi:hypothetical protein A7M85_20015 [Acinetobacter baumannii]|nr:hypothetical protein A7M85_20015 [Acinetobacter baumannii]